MIKNKIAMSLVTSCMLCSTVANADTIDNIVVTAKSNQSIENTAGSISIITAKDIQSMNATSIEEVLEEVVGVNIGVNDSSLGGRNTISIRGTDSKHSLILIDGKRISGSDAQIGHSNFQYNWLPLNAIEKIEVVRGPMSALYGSKAIGGVVNIITKKPDGKISGTASIKKGISASDGGDEKEVALTLGGKITDKLSMTAFVQKIDSDLVENKDDKTANSDREGKELINKMLSVWYDIDDTQQVSATIIKGDETRKYQSKSARPPFTTTMYDEFYEIDKSHQSIAYKKNFDDITLDLKYYKTESDSHTQEFKYTHEIENNVMNAELSIDKFDNNFLIVGLEKSTEKYRKRYDLASDDATKGFTGEVETKSIFVQDEIELNKNTLVVLGGRYDKHEKFGGNFSPKVNVVYKLDSQSRLKIGYGEGFNAPTVTQNSSNFKFDGRHVFLGNDDLQPETSKSIEIGYEKTTKEYSLKASIFKTEIKDLIDGKVISSAPLYPGGPMKNTNLYSNVAESSMQGVELEFNKKRLFANTDLHIGYNYLKTEDKETGKELSGKTKHKLNMALKTKFINNMNSTFRIKYTGTQMNKEDVKQNAYTIADLQLSKEFTKSITAQVGVDNVTNKQLKNEDNYQIKGRLVYLKLSYSF
jgi:outer membrane receptor for ferrienterochelin and colicins